ncbi:MAG: DUF692 domain-containing protein [Alphaproteobacteria bacterium]
MRTCPPSGCASSWSLPTAAGIGLRHPHIGDFLAERQPVEWVEVHSENFLGDGGPDIAALTAIRSHLPVACHGVGLSLGSVDGLDEAHLARLVRLFNRIQPALVSEHIAWSAFGGTYLNDLLPLPWTEEALAVLCRNIDAAQQAFRRRILIENPSTYFTFPQSTIPEWEFVSEVVRRTGCGLLLDVNNLYVSAANQGTAYEEILNSVPYDAVGEIHLGGHSRHKRGDEDVLIDDHGSKVCDEVWKLYAGVLSRVGAVPTLIEWDTSIPDLSVLLAEAATANHLLVDAEKGFVDVA